MDFSRTMVIAECGSCHDMDFGKARRLINGAHWAGADVAKFQYWSSAERMATRRNAADYEAIYRRYQIPRVWLGDLAAYAAEVGIGFMCSTYLPEDVQAVMPFVEVMKIASFEANDPQHLSAHIPALMAGKDVVVSMGMGASPAFVRKWLPRVQVPDAGRVWLMHCVSAYPAPVEELGLSRINDRSDEWPMVGFSDHSDPRHEAGLWTGALAVAAGALIVERHLCLAETESGNPDIAAALPPSPFASYVQNVRLAEVAMLPRHGPGCEDQMRPYRVGVNS